jgi:hypothetical protein
MSRIRPVRAALMPPLMATLLPLMASSTTAGMTRAFAHPHQDVEHLHFGLWGVTSTRGGRAA